MTIESPSIFILLLIVPCLLITTMIYYLGKKYLEKEYRIAYMKNQSEIAQRNAHLKLNAHERIAVLLERMTFPALLYRTQMQGMEANELEAAMLVTIQKEYEHNQAQQIYVSENLWKIIRLAKDDLSNLIMEARTEEEMSIPTYSQRLMKAYSQWNPNPVDVAISANITETKSITG